MYYAAIARLKIEYTQIARRGAAFESGAAFSYCVAEFARIQSIG
jgi:hypothetical protein